MSLSARDLLAVLAVDHASSGVELAARFGVTRAAIWKQIDALRHLGVPIQARAGEGYRLAAPIDLLDREVIVGALPVHLHGRLGNIEVHWQIDSTNSALLRSADTDGCDNVACLAELQTRGRGRRGRGWHMPLTGGLALSLRRRFDASMGALAGLSLAVGVALVRALADAGFPGVGLKWPNDVVANDRKLAGILIELGGDALGPCHAVIGIGLNVRIGDVTTTQIDQPWIDLAELTHNAPPSRNQLAAGLLTHLVESLDRFADAGLAGFAEDFAECDVLRGRMVRILGSVGGREGIALGIDARGRLRVRGDDGEFAVDSGEVSVRPQPGHGT